jgi:fumarylpyruvate hydrolase
MSTAALVIPAPPQPSVPVADDGPAGAAPRFPVRRIYCVGRNYAEHAKEMGAPVEKGRPVFFCKPADAVVEPGRDPRYPSGTELLHHEVELVVALQRGGRPRDAAEALELVYGYAVGNDLTRRDLQHQCKAKGLPWDIAKGFDDSAPISAIRPAALIGHPSRGAIALAVNGEPRQRADLSDMLWSVPEVLIELGKLFELAPGDLVYMGTPAGVGELRPGDVVEASIEGVGALGHRMA